MGIWGWNWFFKIPSFNFLSTTMKLPKKFEKFSKWSKKFKLHKKLNDGSLGYWEKYFRFSDMSLRYFKMHLKIFLEALFLELLELFRISKIHCRQILWNFELKLSHIKIRGSDYMVCNFFLDPTSRWFFKRGLAFPTRHTVCIWYRSIYYLGTHLSQFSDVVSSDKKSKHYVIARYNLIASFYHI